MARKSVDSPVTKKDLADAFRAFTKTDLAEAFRAFGEELNKGLDARFSKGDARFQSIDERFDRMDERFETIDERFKETKDSIMRLAVEMDRRFEQTASKKDLAALTDKVDRYIAGLDRSSGELLDNRRTLIVFDAAIGDLRRSVESHERRLNSLETGHPPK